MKRFDVLAAPGGELAIRAHPRGIGVLGFMQPNLLYPRWPVQILVRALRRDRAWALSICKYDDDPFGPFIYEETVNSKAAVPARMAELKALASSGSLTELNGGG